MGVEVSIPERDRPRRGVVAAVAVGGLVIGLALAWWGTLPLAGGGPILDRGEGGRRPQGGEGIETARGLGAESGTESGAGAGAGSESEFESESESETGTESESESESETGTGAGGGAGSGTGAGTGAGTGTGTGSGAGSESASGSEDVHEHEHEDEGGAESGLGAGTGTGGGGAAAPAGSLSVRRGRVAYLRCEGVARQGGRFPCPRDEALEAAVWRAIDGLMTCPSAPRIAGRADLRLAYAADGAPEVAWRDTFADDVVRLDEGAVLGCLREPLAATRQSIGAERLLVSFRFRVE